MDAIDFNFSDFGGFLLSIGGYAASGFTIGTFFFPGVGNIIGAVIGGVVATIGDTVIDGSVRSRIEQLKSRL